MKASHLLAIVAFAAAGAAQAQPVSPASTPMSQGEVLKVLPKAVLLKHGPIANIGMDAMTMQFGVADAKLLKSVKAGDKVRFAVDRVNGQFVVTRIERAQ
ncbi:copper-binding protein [Caenimonas soli]|jgi:Cu/Ag efflux protein CusF|uniref:copper-binding protein n=1 Tax=Caenimonas soli TaxID=2735555 RepID=UPI001A9A7D32|nr:copper-binding protein [Caenimonas soli]